MPRVAGGVWPTGRKSPIVWMVRRLALAVALVAVAAWSAAGAAFLLERAVGEEASSGPDCTYALPTGASLGAAQETTALFVRAVVLRAQPRCGYALGSERLRIAFGPERWATGDTPVRPFVSRYPATAYKDANPDPKAREAVYVISRIAGAATGSPLLMVVGLSAPDAGVGAYRIQLVLDGDNWRVDRWWRVEISVKDL